MCCPFMLEYLGKKILWSATVVQHNVCYACFGFKGHLGSQLLLCYSCAAAIPGHETLCLAPKMSNCLLSFTVPSSDCLKSLDVSGMRGIMQANMVRHVLCWKCMELPTHLLMFRTRY